MASVPCCFSSPAEVNRQETQTVTQNGGLTDDSIQNWLELIDGSGRRGSSAIAGCSEPRDQRREERAAKTDKVVQS
ncbi:hypothetical protein E2C01_060782 [Portunus trituberculatus]|uniref:Uncharacterized protein n=1 Tax=Portunus trituberculatus TaxID=210409 RepID=A0A5B7H6H3_PORTR|nr:hypothetical protein [Portunus trituberculatus]